MKNKKKLIVLSVIAAILIVVFVLVIIYFTTDFLKTEQQLFYKYIAKTEILNLSILEQYKDVNDKINNNSNSSLANFDISLATHEKNTGVADVQKILTITSNGLKNNLTKQSYRDFVFLNNEQNLLTLKYIRDDKIYALKIENILAKYLGVENVNLKELFSKIGVEDTSNIPDSIQIDYEEILKIDEPTLNQLKETYGTLIYNNIGQKKFYKILNSDRTEIIGVSLTEKEVSNILKVMLETAKNDKLFLDLLINKAQLLNYNNITIENIQTEIQRYIDEIVKQTYSDEKDFIKISLVKKKNNIIKLILENNYKKEENEEVKTDFQEFQKNINNKIEIDFSQPNKYTVSLKENENELVNVIINYYNNDNNLIFNVELESKDGKEIINSIKVHYKISGYKTDNIVKDVIIDTMLDTEKSYQITYDNIVNLKQDVQISKLTTENSVKLNNLNAEEIKQVFATLMNRINESYSGIFANLNMNNNVIEYTENVNEQYEKRQKKEEQLMQKYTNYIDIEPIKIY